MANVSQISLPVLGKSVIGPYDARNRRTRCESCAKRRIKCEGGFPCRNCNQKQLHCIVQSFKPGSAVVFVHQTRHSFGKASIVPVHKTPTPALSSIPLDHFTQLSKYFFSVFLSSHNTGGPGIDTGTISTCFQQYPSLRNAAIGVAALDLSRRSTSASTIERNKLNLLALRTCRTSLVALQTDLLQHSLLKNDACLWATYFLGIFELMYDVTGEGWITHFLYGTSKILQSRGANEHLNGPGRSFFLTVRIFEICRSLIFNESTYLNQPKWQILMSKIWLEDSTQWHPLEALLDLIIDCIALYQRAKVFLTQNSEPPCKPSYGAELQSLATIGLNLQSEFYSWRSQFLIWTAKESSVAVQPDPRSKLASIYFHAILIYLSGIYDYWPNWQYALIATPSLTQVVVESCVAGIITESESALRHTNLCGLVFMFPLRVAGARARAKGERERIVTMFGEISSRNFIVAGTLKQELMKAWESME